MKSFAPFTRRCMPVFMCRNRSNCSVSTVSVAVMINTVTAQDEKQYELLVLKGLISFTLKGFKSQIEE